MAFSFNTSLSGLNANSNALSVVGNNIANANTIGFRNSTISFVDVFADSRGARLNGAGNPLQIGNGVQTGAVHTSFKQGNLNESDSPLQAAVQGNGFFVLRNADGSAGYTRAGDFTVDKQGFLVASSGAQVQGYQAQNGVIQPGAALSALQIPIGQTIAPQVTTEASLRMNLDAGAATGATFYAPVQVYDSRGTVHSLELTFNRQSDGSFQMTGTLDGNPVQGAGSPGSPVNFTFDANGTLVTPTSLSITPDQTQLDGAVLPSIAINLRETNPDGTPGAFNITSYARPSAVAATTQDGYSAGELNAASVDSNGYIFGSFTNGQSRIMGQYALATFNSSDGLQRLGGNMFTETIASGQANIGGANSGGRGAIAGGYLEQSNVNITNEFVELIEAQRGFQANSRVITTLNQTIQDLLQIV
jgi:flagellar hook protein FlgE